LKFDDGFVSTGTGSDFTISEVNSDGKIWVYNNQKLLVCLETVWFLSNYDIFGVKK